MARKTINTTKYIAAAFAKPAGFGNWTFRNVRTGDTFTARGNYGDAKRQVPAGEWELMA